MTTYRELYNFVDDEYKPKNIDSVDLKMKITSLLKDIDIDKKEILSQVLLSLIYNASDPYIRVHTNKLWRHDEINNIIKINLDNLLPYVRGIIDTFIEMYLSDQLSGFY